jgi:hypothetical protein
MNARETRIMKRLFTSVLAPAAVAVCVSLLPGCGSDERDESGIEQSDAPSSGEGAAEPVGAAVDPCSLLSIEELQTALLELEGPAQPDPLNHQCIYASAFVKVGPVSREDVKLEHELFGLEPRPIEITGAEWAVLRIDTEEGKALEIVDALPDELTGRGLDQPGDGETLEVFDVIATGASGTVTLAPTGDHHPALNSPEHEALIRLLRLAYSRL